MFVKELFDKENITCPSWLENKYIDNNWQDSNYVNEQGIHNWFLKNSLQDLHISFDGKEYHFKGYDVDGSLLVHNIITETFTANMG